MCDRAEVLEGGAMRVGRRALLQYSSGARDGIATAASAAAPSAVPSATPSADGTALSAAERICSICALCSSTRAEHIL